MALDNRTHPNLLTRRPPATSAGSGGFAAFDVRLATGEVVRFLTQARTGLADLRPAYVAVVENLRRLERRAFDTQTAPTGEAWDDLADKTVRARTHRWGHYRRPSTEGPARRVLHWTHALRRSLLEDDVEGSVRSISASTLVYGTTIPYAAALQRRRPFLSFTRDQITTEIEQPIARHLFGTAPAAGAGRRVVRRLGAVVAAAGAGEAAD